MRDLFEPRRDDNRNPTALASSPSSSSSSYSSSELDSSAIGWRRGRPMQSWIRPVTRPFAKIGWDVNHMVMEPEDHQRKIKRNKVSCDWCSRGFTIRCDAVDYWDKWAETCHIPPPAWCCNDRCAYAYNQLPQSPIPEHIEDVWWNNGYYHGGFRLEPAGWTIGPVATKLYHMYELEIPISYYDARHGMVRWYSQRMQMFEIYSELPLRE